eukprot:XP_001696600.1 predicted protein [Chlamydomonas reinhardtii]
MQLSVHGAVWGEPANRLELVARRFVSNVVGWPGGSGGGSNEEEEVRGGEQQPQAGDVGSGDIETAARVASMMLAPGAAVHVGGVWADVLAPGQPNNEDALFEYLSRERAAYQLLELQPLAVAVAVDSEPAVAGLGGGGGGAAADPTPTAAAAAHGRELIHTSCLSSLAPPTHACSVSEGLRVDELRFDPEAKIAAAWCTRQLTQASELAPHKMMQVAALWSQAIRSRDDAKAALAALCASYEGVDLLLFAPSGKLQAIAQFRRVHRRRTH